MIHHCHQLLTYNFESAGKIDFEVPKDQSFSLIKKSINVIKIKHQVSSKKEYQVTSLI